MTQSKALELIMAELTSAEKKHPKWPADRLRQVVVVAEEAGEALKTALTIIETEEKIVHRQTARALGVIQNARESADDLYSITLDYNNLAKLEEDLQAEVVQTAAMALRWLINRRPLYAEA